MNTFEITFERNSVYQINLVKAGTTDQAENYFRNRKPDARIIAVKPATEDSYKPGMPILMAAGSC